jgi:hypothetical protein
LSSVEFPRREASIDASGNPCRRALKSTTEWVSVARCAYRTIAPTYRIISVRPASHRCIAPRISGTSCVGHSPTRFRQNYSTCMQPLDDMRQDAKPC